MTLLLDLLLGRARRASAPPPATHASIAIDVPPVDTGIDEGQSDDDAFLAEAIAIEYCDAVGALSRRRITVRRAVSKDDDFLLHAYCHERRAPRCFRASRIRAVFNISTGEIIDDPNEVRRVAAEFAAWRIRTPRHATEAALYDHRAGVVILMFLARCDGEEHLSEREVILTYLDHSCPPPGLDVEFANRCLDRLYPDPQSFARAVEVLARRDIAELRRVARHVRRLIDADGALSAEEAAFAQELETAM